MTMWQCGNVTMWQCVVSCRAMRAWIKNPFVLLFFLPVPFLHGCKAQSNPSINGTLHMSPGWNPVLYLIQPHHFQEIAADYLGPVVDSATIHEDGSFSFKTVSTSKDKTLFILAIQPKGSRYPNHLIDEDPSKANYMPVVYTPGEKLQITADVNSFQSSFSLKSISKENLNLFSLRDIRKNAFALYVQQAGDMEDDSLIIEKEKALNHYIGSMMSFADSTSVVEAAMLAVRWISPTNDYERHPNSFMDNVKSGLLCFHRMLL